MAIPQHAVSLIQQLSDLQERIATGTDQDATNHALQLSRRLTLSLAHPANTAVDLAFSPFIAVAARIAIDLGLFKLIANQGNALSSNELAMLSGGEELLISKSCLT